MERYDICKEKHSDVTLLTTLISGQEKLYNKNQYVDEITVFDVG